MHGFPLFLSLKDRPVLVVGGGMAAARKIELLLSAGAAVVLIAESVTGELAQLIADRHIRWAGPIFSDSHLTGAALAIVASDDEGLRQAVSRAAQVRGVPVNVVDCPALSSFLMPAVVDRGPVTVAISTGGTAPALARKLRADIERLLPTAVGRLARLAGLFRDPVRRTLSEPRVRRRFWDRVFAGPIAGLALAGDEIAARRELIRLLDGVRTEGAPAGMVYWLSVGGDDPDLLTLKAHRLLQQADAIVCDRSVPRPVLGAARRDAERIYVDAPAAPRLIALARDGQKVVRLAVGSDDGEIASLRAAEVAVELLPGVARSERDVSQDKRHA
jgi:uroporphyrin-III C-methyltransferase/precorrin-2 dehydrogenase/sirohydrochlorin ferrochelatase